MCNSEQNTEDLQDKNSKTCPIDLFTKNETGQDTNVLNINTTHIVEETKSDIQK